MLTTEIVTDNGKLSFRPKARLLRLLGDELISDEVMAIVELVKNSYDADARNVLVRMQDLTDSEQSCIEVRDDGTGMTLDTVLHSWLEPATDHKGRKGNKKRTSLGRYPLGEKGVGRFAAAKLGREMELVTKAHGEAQEVRVHIRWDLFGEGGYLDEVENHWETGTPTHFGSNESGTLVRIRRLHAPWEGSRITKIREGMARLVSPFSAVHDFAIVLECPDYPEHAGTVASRLLDHAPYRLSGHVDSSGTMHLDGEGGVVDLRQAASERFMSDGAQPRLPSCGPFRLALFIWDLDSASLKKAGMSLSLKQELKRSSGISIFRDGFRVWPYGTPGDDWLELNQRRVNNPTERVSTNQIVGIVEVTQEHNPELRDRTSREGLIETEGLHDLKALVQSAISRLEDHRLSIRRQAVQPCGDEQAQLDPVLALISQAMSRSQAGEATRPLLDRLSNAYRQKVATEEARQEYLMRLASTGRAMETIAREMSHAVGEAATALTIVQNTMAQIAGGDIGGQYASRLRRQLSLLGHQLGVVESLSSSQSEEPLDLRLEVHAAARLFALPMKETATQLLIDAPLPVTVVMGRADLMQVLAWLFDNSLERLRRGPSSSTPTIRVELRDAPARLLIMDSGGKISREVWTRCLETVSTSKGNGLAPGLFLVHTVLNRYGATIALVEETEPPIGAAIQITLPQVQSGD